MTKTTNYQLPKWEKTDRIQMKDFNDMTATLDAALKANADAIAETAAACGNCRIVYGSYVGNGQYGSSNPKTLTFDGTPLFVALSGRYHFFAVKGCSFVQTLSSPSLADLSLPLTWGDRSVSWYSTENADKQQNLSGTDSVSYTHLTLPTTPYV